MSDFGLPIRPPVRGLGWTYGVENSTNCNPDPSFLFDLYTYRRPILHRLATIHNTTDGFVNSNIHYPCPIYIYFFKTRKPANWRAGRTATSLIQEWLPSRTLAITYSENVYAHPCIYSHWQLERDNNTKSAICVMHRWRQVHADPIFVVKKHLSLGHVFGVKMQVSNGLQNETKMTHLNPHFQNCRAFRNRLNSYWKIATPAWPKTNMFMRFADDRK